MSEMEAGDALVLDDEIVNGEGDEVELAQHKSEETLQTGSLEGGETCEDEKEEEKIYGGCEGPDAMYVKLISSDGHEFIVKREHALTSGTIKAMLSGPGQFAENETNEVNFREIPSHVLQKVCMYFAYKEMGYTAFCHGITGPKLSVAAVLYDMAN